MKKYAYIIAILFLTATSVSAQIKIGNYTFKDGAEYTGELKGKKPNGKGRTVLRVETFMKVNTLKESVKVTVLIFSMMEKSMKENGFRTNNMVREFSIS